MTEPSRLYFIQCGEGGPIKIGISSDPVRRMSGMQVACPYPLALLHDCGPLLDARAYEQRLHARYAPYRLSGEWFLPTDSLLGFIRQIVAVDAIPTESEDQ